MVCSCSLHKYLTVIRMPQIFSNTDPCQDMLRFSNPSERFQWNRAGRQQKDWKTQGTLQLCMRTIHQSCSHFDHRSPQKIVEVHSRFTFGRPVTLNWGFYFFKKKRKTSSAYFSKRLDTGPESTLRTLWPLYFRKGDVVPGEVWGPLEAPQQKTKHSGR